MILDNPLLIDYSEAVAMTYLEVYSLDRPSLDAVCKQFPEVRTHARACVRMTTRSLLCMCACVHMGMDMDMDIDNADSA